MRRISGPKLALRKRWISNGAFFARANISEINSVCVDSPRIVAHNDESSSATSR